MSYYIGQTTIADLLGAGNPRYFYALRRTDDGLLYFSKIDQIKDTAQVTVNQPGLAENSYEGFEYGTDFFEGRLENDHSRPYTNLNFDQYRWDNKNIYYYINDNGEFVVRVNQEFPYPPESIVG